MIKLYFFLAAFAAEVTGTVAGFGSSTLFLPLALLWVDFPTALVLTAFLHIFGNITRIAFFRHRLDKNLLFFFGLPSIILTIVGALLVTYIASEMLKLFLGIFLFIFSMSFFIIQHIKLHLSPFKAVISGGFSGFLAGLIGTGGALRGFFLNAFGLKKETYIATAAAIAFAVDITRIPVYIRSGFLQPGFYDYIPVLFVIALAGSFTGKKIVQKIPQKIFRKLVLVAIAMASLKFIYDGLKILI